MKKEIDLYGLPMDCGSKKYGCSMAPQTLRACGLNDVISQKKLTLNDKGDLELSNIETKNITAGNSSFSHIHKIDENVAGIAKIIKYLKNNLNHNNFNLFLGGDHIISMATINAVSQSAKIQNQPLFVLWIDAHSDFHTIESTDSGNLHGTPVAYISGLSDFEPFCKMHHPVPYHNICMLGIRSMDQEEKIAIHKKGINIIDMRLIDECGISKPLNQFLSKVKQQNGLLHVSFDCDAIDQSIAPALGTPVKGGLTYREIHLIMEILSDSKLVSSMDLVEVNPLLDIKSKTSHLIVDCCASLFGKRILSP